MIILITGAPGTGKTAMAVSQLLDFSGKRPIFQMGIPELKIDHFETPPVENWTEMRKAPEDETLELPYFTFPDNAIVIIDEAQRVYRPRPATSKVPPHVAAFETHRHCGIDFILITQSPTLLDGNIRRLIGRHIHIRATSLGRYSYEWPECGEVESKTSRDSAIKKKYKLPKKVFKLYKSASLHTKQERAIHPGVIIVAVCVLAFLVGGYYLYGSIRAKVEPATSPPQAGRGGSTPEREQVKPLPPVEQKTALEDFTPRDPDRPFTAPAYDGLRQVRSMPRVAACIATRERCVCYTQQATRLDVTEGNCRRIAKSGDFDPYAADTLIQPAMQQIRPVEAQQVSNVPPPSGGPVKGLPESGMYVGVSGGGGPVLSFDKALYGGGGAPSAGL